MKNSIEIRNALKFLIAYKDKADKLTEFLLNEIPKGDDSCPIMCHFLREQLESILNQTKTITDVSSITELKKNINIIVPSLKAIEAFFLAHKV